MCTGSRCLADSPRTVTATYERPVPAGSRLASNLPEVRPERGSRSYIDDGFAFDDRTIGLTEEQTEILGVKLREWGHFFAVDALADDNKEQLVGLFACLLRTWTVWCEEPLRPAFHTHVMHEVFEGALAALGDVSPPGVEAVLVRDRDDETIERGRSAFSCAHLVDTTNDERDVIMTTQQVEKLSDTTLELLRRTLDSDRHGIGAAAAEWLTARLAELFAESRSRVHGGHLVEVEEEDGTWLETFGVAQRFQAYCHCDWWGDEHLNRVATVAEGDQHLAEVRR